MTKKNFLADLPVVQDAAYPAPAHTVPADSVLGFCRELESELATLDIELIDLPTYPRVLDNLKKLLKMMQVATAGEQATVVVDGKELTAHDAHHLATFARALRENACPYCAQPIHYGKAPTASGASDEH
jgi:hypothetical protein